MHPRHVRAVRVHRQGDNKRIGIFQRSAGRRIAWLFNPRDAPSLPLPSRASSETAAVVDGKIMTWSGSARTPRCMATWASTASRSSRRPHRPHSSSRGGGAIEHGRRDTAPKRRGERRRGLGGRARTRLAATRRSPRIALASRPAASAQMAAAPREYVRRRGLDETFS